MPILNWSGKDKVVNHHNDVPYCTLERQYVEGASESDNMIIHGDNLIALKALLPKYEGKIKCIYIDPPYNTGNEEWVYNDNVNDPTIKKWLGEVVGKEGEDFSRHDKWLCMMYPRLRLLQKLLSDDGAIFISIDDNELYNLKLICDEIFGSSNFLANYIWYNTGHTDKQDDITNVHEYILCYAKKKTNIQINNIVDPATKEDSKILNSYAENSITKNGPKNPPSEIILPIGFPCEIEKLKKAKHKNVEDLIEATTQHHFISREMTKQFEVSYPARRDDMEVEDFKLIKPCRVFSGWMNNGKLKQFIANGCMPLMEESGTILRFYLSKNGVLYYRREGRQCHYVQTVLQELGTTERNKYVLEEMGIKFDYPKPIELLSYLISFYSNKDSIILDSFAGSGTTAHAVLKMNQEDGGNRKFILVEMMDYAETITAERVRRVIHGYGEGKKAVPGTGGSFGYYELGEPLMVDNVLNESLPIERIREYVWHMEQRASSAPYQEVAPIVKENPYLLGVLEGTAVYFCYEREKEVCLDYALLRQLKTQAENYVIYADTCLLSAAELTKYKITFKKIPRDIVRL